MNYRTRIALGVIAGVILSVGVTILISLSLKTGGVKIDTKLDQRIEQLGYENTREQRAAEAAKRGIWGWQDTAEQKEQLLGMLPAEGDLGFGVVTDYQKVLSAPMTATQSFIPATSLVLKDGTTLTMDMLGDKVFITLEPGATKEEIAMCTGIDSSTVRFTGCTRGLAFSGTSTAAVSANQKTHSSGATIVISNVHYVYNQYFDKSTTSSQSILGPVVFSFFPAVTSTTASPVTGGQLATKYYVDNVGAGGFTASNVSSTLGLQAISSGTPNCPTAAACVGINASSTASTNGGFLSFTAGTGKLFWDILSFLSGSWTWSGTNTFSSIRATSTSLGLTFTPTSTTDATNKAYVDSSISSFVATGTAGAPNIYPGDALYISTTGTLFLADADATSTAQTFIGISLSQASSTGSVNFVRAGGVVTNIASLTAGVDYYLSGTAGAITATRPSLPTLPVIIGRSLSASRLLVKDPTIRLTTFANLTNITSDQVVNMGVTPDKIIAYCGNESDAASGNIGGGAVRGQWTWDKFAGTSSTQSNGFEDDAVPYSAWTRSDFVCAWEEGTTIFAAKITPSQTGFTLDLNAAWEGAARDASYIAEYTYP